MQLQKTLVVGNLMGNEKIDSFVPLDVSVLVYIGSTPLGKLASRLADSRGIAKLDLHCSPYDWRYIGEMLETCDRLIILTNATTRGLRALKDGARKRNLTYNIYRIGPATPAE